MKTKKIYYLILILSSITFLGCDSEDDKIAVQFSM